MPKARQTCTSCSMRRQKCDREVPCGRCVKRGDAAFCTRVWTGGQYDPKVHRVYPRHDTNASLTTSGNVDPLPAVNGSATAQVSSALHNATHPGQGLGRVGSEMLSLPHGRHEAHQYGTNPSLSSSKSAQSGDMENAASVLEFLTWGRSKLTEYDVQSVDLLKPQFVGRHVGLQPDVDLVDGLGETGAGRISFLQLLLPKRQQVFQLVEYHTSSILWYHGCYHGPTFTRELQDVYKSPNTLQLQHTDLRWAALLFSIMAGSMTCASEHTVASWGFSKSERPGLTKRWLKATVCCLEIADYLSRHHIYSVQAIAVLTISSHLLGYSDQQSVLLAAATRIAQSLGLQRLGPEVDEMCLTIDMTSALREKVVRRETGRRVWCQLCVQDWFSIPFSEMYSISSLQFTTSKPINCNDETMAPLPKETPTRTSFGNYLFDIAAFMPHLHDALLTSSTLFTKYERVLEYDAKMRTLATDLIPEFFSRRELIHPSWPKWIAWARRSLSIAFAHKIIMIHRSFLGRSFTDASFAFTRKTCIAAAKTILKEAQQAYDDEGPLLWIDQAFMVAASITLSLDVFHRTKDEPEFEEHRLLVAHTINMLGKFQNSMIASRGTRLLSSLLSELSKQQVNKNWHGHKRMGDVDGDPRDSKKQKFNIPSFVESFRSNENYSQWLGSGPKGPDARATDLWGADEAQISREQGLDASAAPPELSYDTFAELFPPQTGISNQFLFEDLLNFDVY